MAVTVNATTDYRGKSTDTKPTDADINALFLEVDTQDFYYFDTDNDWHKVGGSASRAKSTETDLKKSLENLEEVKEDVRDEPLEEKETALDEWGDISEPEPESKSKASDEV
jgi:ribosome-binding ATPase YchF (GTP1/OBG family)